VLTRLLQALVDLVLPAPCGGCGTTVPPGTALCPACAGTLRRPLPAPERPDLPPAMALAPYTGAARHAVIAYKERGRRDLAVPLADALGAALARLADGGCLLVPAPSRAAAARARGGDHMLRIARRLARDGHGHVVPALALARGARDSVGLDAAARAANLAAHLRVRPGALADVPARHGPVVLLDDVFTTGATAAASATALAAAGLPVDLGLVLTAVGAVRPRVPGGVVPHAAAASTRPPTGPTRADDPPQGPARGRRVRPDVGFPRPAADPSTPSGHPRESVPWPTSPVRSTDRRRERRTATSQVSGRRVRPLPRPVLPSRTWPSPGRS
jgi:predicted amidophosphoribosyltransferase